MSITVIRVALMSAIQVEQVDLPKLCVSLLTTYVKHSTHRAGIQAPLVFRNVILYARCDLVASNSIFQTWYDL